MNKFLYCLCAVAMGIFVVQNAAHAKGTAATTQVTNVARVAWLNNGNSTDTVSLSADTAVARVIGDSLLVTGNQSMAIGETKYFVYEVYNTGNSTETIAVWVDSVGLFGGASAWTVTLLTDTIGNPIAVQNDTIYLRNLAVDAMKYCTVAVWSNSTPANSPDGSFGIFRLNVRVDSRAGTDTDGEYVGDNGVTYGYGRGSNDTSRATVAAARLALTKAITNVTLYGNPSMPLPGATILYTLSDTNQGTASADSVVIRDTIPTNTTFDTASSTMANLGCSAVLAADSGASGWTAQVSVQANPTSHALYSIDWINLPQYTAAAGTVRHIRWIRQTVLSGEASTLRFRVLIN